MSLIYTTEVRNGNMGYYWNNSNSCFYSNDTGKDIHFSSDNTIYVDAPMCINRSLYVTKMTDASSYINTSQDRWDYNYKYVNSSTKGSNGGDYYNRNGIYPNANYSLITWYRILCGDEINVYSDKRIKQNICEIPKEFALNTIRNLVPCTYNYKDVVNKGTRTNYGFIAQEVDEILPSVVEKSADFIPNIYEVANISENRITLSNFSTKDLLTQDTNVKIKMFNHENKEFIVALKEIIDDKTFSIQESILEVLDNKIFVYGQQVDDMHSLEKNAIFSITTAAVKYLDIELQETKSIIEKQEEIDNLKNELKNLKDFIMTNIK